MRIKVRLLKQCLTQFIWPNLFFLLFFVFVFFFLTQETGMTRTAGMTGMTIG